MSYQDQWQAAKAAYKQATGQSVSKTGFGAACSELEKALLNAETVSGNVAKWEKAHEELREAAKRWVRKYHELETTFQSGGDGGAGAILQALGTIYQAVERRVYEASIRTGPEIHNPQAIQIKALRLK